MKTKQKFQPEQLTINSKKQLKALRALIGGLTKCNEKALKMKDDSLDDLYFDLGQLMDKYNLEETPGMVEITVIS